MRAVVQRVSEASVKIDGNVVGEIGKGFVVLLGIKTDDTEKEVTWLANKICSLRVFEDEDGKMNKELADFSGSILLISQFTLYGDCIKGKRPGFIDAARPEVAIPLYEKFKEVIKKNNITLATGVFGADMKVSLINDGPTTLIIDTVEANLKK